MKLAKAKNSLSSEGFGEQQSYHTTSDSSEAELYDRKKKYRPYEEISREFKNIKPPTFNGEIEKGKKQSPGVVLCLTVRALCPILCNVLYQNI